MAEDESAWIKAWAFNQPKQPRKKSHMNLCY